MSTFPNRIDVHHHLFPPTFVRAMTTKGLTDVAGMPLPSGWVPAHSLALMAQYDIATAILSLPAPLTLSASEAMSATSHARAMSTGPI